MDKDIYNPNNFNHSHHHIIHMKSQLFNYLHIFENICHLLTSNLQDRNNKCSLNNLNIKFNNFIHSYCNHQMEQCFHHHNTPYLQLHHHHILLYIFYFLTDILENITCIIRLCISGNVMSMKIYSYNNHH